MYLVERQVGHLKDVTDRAFLHVSNTVKSGAVAGAVLGAVDRAGRQEVRHIGWAQCVPEHIPMRSDTCFDLASLTKVLFTTVQVLKEVVDGAIDLDAPLATVLPELRGNSSGNWLQQVSFRQCLAHRTPFPASEPYYLLSGEPSDLRQTILNHVWFAGPPVYSDVNFILLGLALERLRGQSVAEMDPGWGFTFAPHPENCAATERCVWRQRVLRGEIHDENAFALGGAGHAGLFGTMENVLSFAQGVLDESGFPKNSLALMKEPGPGYRTLGWEHAHTGWSGGDACKQTVIGHTGFTGTGLWIDHENGVAWALLTNRVHPSRADSASISTLRRTVGDVFSES